VLIKSLESLSTKVRQPALSYTHSSSIFFTISDTCRPLVNGTKKCAYAMVVASTKDARREGGIMPTLSIGNSITVHVYVIIFFRFQFLLNFLLPSRGRRKCRL